MIPSLMLYDFSQNSTSDWKVVDDGVMGGLSEGNFYVNPSGNGVFEGEISLKNNGGFSSIRHQMNANIAGHSKVKITLKGDGKQYQFRLKSSPKKRHSYVAEFETSGEWEVIEIQLSQMYPVFHGRKLDIPDFNSDRISEISFLIGNEKAETFRLEISKIELI